MPEAFDISAFGHFVFDKTVVTAQDNEKEPIESKLFCLISTASCYIAGLPDGLFLNQNIQIWVNFGGP
jgi:hypothetical protein